MTIVTRESLQSLLNRQDPVFVSRVVGKALVALLANQTSSEVSGNSTEVDNGIGFSSADARSATITAKTFIKHGSLQDWQVERWTRPTKNGFSRLTKYANQLNAIAEQKRSVV